jgi:hypothetical protein
MSSTQPPISSVVDQHCAAIREQGATMTIEQLKTLFDEFVSELKRPDTSSIDITSTKQIVSTLLNLPDKSKLLAESELVLHPLLIFLRDYVLLDLLRRRQGTDIGYDLLINLSMLFANICHGTHITNVQLCKQLVLHKSLIDELASCFDEIGTSGKHLDNSDFLSSIRFLLIAFQRLQKKQTKNDEFALTTPLFFAVLKCMCSSYTVDTLTGLENKFSQKLTERQKLLLSECPLFLWWFSGNSNPEQVLQVPRALLGPFTIWIINCHADLIIHCSQECIDMMRHLTSILVRPIDWENANISSREFYDDYCKLVSHYSSFLSVIFQHSADKFNLTSVARFIVQDLYNFTLHPNILDYMKSIPSLIPMLVKISDVQQNETQLNAYRCLGKIMIEEDIKTMGNPSKIAMIYVKFLSNSIDDPRKKERFYSLLDSLKSKFYLFHVI